MRDRVQTWTKFWRSTHLNVADLAGANLDGADLNEVVFEPTNLPTLKGIAQARDLALMRYGFDITTLGSHYILEPGNPGLLAELRKQFQDAGYREQERAITCALNRREAELASPVDR